MPNRFGNGAQNVPPISWQSVMIKSFDSVSTKPVSSVLGKPVNRRPIGIVVHFLVGQKQNMCQDPKHRFKHNNFMVLYLF